MQKRIMARYHATQTIDIASLRDLTQAKRSVANYRDDLLQEKIDDLIQSLRLSARFSPAQRQIQAYLRAVQEREPSQETFQERKTHHADLETPLVNVRRRVEQLPDQTRALLQEIERSDTDEQQVQQKLGVLLVSLDQIDADLRTLHNTISARHQASVDQLSRDQQRAARMSALLLVFAFAAFAIAVLAIWRALSPIQRLTKAASQVGQGDFDIERIRAGKDEIGQLTDAFHAMTQRLAARDHALLTAHQEREEAYQKLILEEKARIGAERLAVVGELSARITHELRNPLSSLSLNIEMILEDPHLQDLEADTHDMLLSMKHEIERLEALSGAYLSLARKPTGAHHRISLSELAQSVVSQLQRSAALDGVTLEQRIVPNAWIQGDENELRGVLINLIENARIAVAQTSGARCIRVSVSLKEDHVRCTIEDNGPGVSPALYEQLFEPFVSDRADGTGLGLSTSKRVAEAHQGTLTYTVSDLGGACFTLLLPRHQEATSLA